MVEEDLEEFRKKSKPTQEEFNKLIKPKITAIVKKEGEV